MNKQIEVFTNDPTRSRLILNISGSVREFAKMEPKYARLVGKAGANIRKVVTITREKAYPFTILEAKARSGKDIAVDIEEFSRADADGYRVTIANTRTTAGRYADMVILTTDSPIKRIISVPVYGQILSAAPPADPAPAPPKTDES